MGIPTRPRLIPSPLLSTLLPPSRNSPPITSPCTPPTWIKLRPNARLSSPMSERPDLIKRLEVTNTQHSRPTSETLDERRQRKTMNDVNREKRLTDFKFTETFI